MFDRSLVFLDLETTGASPGLDRITEIGLIEVDRGEYIGEWSSLVNPGRAIPTAIQQLTGITDEMVREAPEFPELAQALHRRLEGKVLVAHNARFDHGFLSNEFRRLGLRYRPEILCTVRLSRKLFPEHPRHNLDSIIERHGLACDNRHRALGDARVLWQFARELQREPGPAAVNAAVDELLRRPSLPPGMSPDALDDAPEGPGVYVIYGTAGAPLFAGKSMNVASRLRAHFSGESILPRDRRIAVEATHVEWFATAGALGMTLLHDRLVRQLSPAQNRRPRQATGAWAIHWDPVDGPAIPQVVDLADAGARAIDGLYGMFRSPRSAINALRNLADDHGLCHIALGLEQGQGPCLGRRLQTCRGLCVGAENAMAHAMRMTQVLHPLRSQAWPFPGRIGVREHDPATGRTEIHVFDRWRYLGSYDSMPGLAESLGDYVLPQPDAHMEHVLRRLLRDDAAGVQILPLS